MPRLSGKTALVTGAAIARAFADEGAHVIVTDIDAPPGRATAEAIGGTFARLDVASEPDWAEIARRFAAVDVVVNNAGITGFEGPFDGAPPPHDREHASLADWRAVHAVNLDGTFLGCRYAIRAMRAKGAGSIISISSRSGLVGIPMAAAYASSKAAIRNHTKNVALFCAGQVLNIRCNPIHPAAVMTPMWEPMLGTGPDHADREAAMVADTPLRRFGRPEEVACAGRPARVRRGHLHDRCRTDDRRRHPCRIRGNAGGLGGTAGTCAVVGHEADGHPPPLTWPLPPEEVPQERERAGDPPTRRGGDLR